MKRLEEMILRKGRALDGEVLLVDSFLNGEVDVDLMREVGETFARAAADLNIDRIATIEASGIAPAAMTALAMKKPLVIMKKAASRITKDDCLQTEVFSFTKNAPYQLILKRRFVQPGDRVLLVDDFLARGEAAAGARKLIEEAGATVEAVGIVIEKSFQPGRRALEQAGLKVISLARVQKMGPEGIEFAPADI